MPTTHGTKRPLHLKWFVLGLGFLVFYGYATIAHSGDTWGLDSLGYLPLWMRIGALVWCLCLLWPAFYERGAVLWRRMRPAVSGMSPTSGNLLLVGLGVISFGVFYTFPIQTEVYGDTRTIVRYWVDNSHISQTWLASLTDMHIEHNDAALTSVLMRTVAHSCNIPIVQAFRIMSALSGALALCIWMQFVRVTFARSRWSILLLFAGYTLGAYQIFFGHVETYAFVFLVMLMFLVTGYLSLSKQAPPWLVVLLFLVALRAHSVTLLFLPSLVFLVASWLSCSNALIERWMTWPKVWCCLVIPTCAAGVMLYLFHFRAVAAPYLGTTAGARPVFLPILATKAPWTYTMFSVAHVVDVVNMLLLVGTPVLVVLLGLVLIHPRAIEWHRPPVIYATLAALFPLIFLFSVNPLLSWPRDWDLGALIGAPLLLLLAALVAHAKATVTHRPAYATALSFSVFSVGFWVLNASPQALSLHLEELGEHVFTTYHASASYLIGSAEGMDPDTTRSIQRRVATIERLGPQSPANDGEYTHLLMMLASVYRERGDRERAVFWMDEAAKAAPSDRDVALHHVDCLVWAGELGRAGRCVAEIVHQDPTNFDALVLAAVVATHEGAYGPAVDYLERAATVRPADPDVAKWLANLKARQASRRV